MREWGWDGLIRKGLNIRDYEKGEKKRWWDRRDEWRLVPFPFRDDACWWC
jgi:hypothetical protein